MLALLAASRRSRRIGVQNRSNSNGSNHSIHTNRVSNNKARNDNSCDDDNSRHPGGRPQRAGGAGLPRAHAERVRHPLPVLREEQ